MPEFSIIVPIYNVETYIRQCIDSILSQSYPGFELILVDDGSPDDCGEICDEYAHKDFRVHVIHKANGGLVSARKAGVSQACGTYILNIDGDDYIGVTLLQQVHEIIAEYAPDMVAFGFKKICDNGAVLEIAENKLSGNQLYSTQDENFYSKLIYDCSIARFNYGAIHPSLCAKAFKRSILIPALLAVPDTVTMGEDLAATNQAMCNCRLIYISKMTEYYYRFNETSITNTFKREMIRRWQALFEFANTHMNKIPQANKDTYACMQIISHISTAARDFTCYDEFLRYMETEITSSLHTIVDRCRIPDLPVKQRILFILLKHYCFWGFWVIYHNRK